ncbi:MAG: GTPase domain-containing protein [bacterium]|nr:GTPase domain-containing protein [bacterium]
MSGHIGDILNRLDHIATYDGAWAPLRGEAPLLRERMQELRQREGRLDDLLVIALVGGSGVGKSTLLNAIAGDLLAATSEFRPCTSVPTVYQPPGAAIAFDGWSVVSGSALENLIIIDTPDSDTVVREHRDIVGQALRQADLILLCGSGEKYLDEATWSLLRPLQNERTLVCVETKAADGAESVRDHWLARLDEQGFDVADYFRVNALRALDRKLGKRTPDGNSKNGEFDYGQLEEFLRQELTREQVRRIKRSNAIGLLTKTLGTLRERVASRADALRHVETAMGEGEEALSRETCRIVRDRLFAESHLWNFAMGREMALRAKGIVGTLFRALEAARSLPTRLAARLPFGARGRSGQRAAALLTERSLLTGDIDVASEAVRQAYDEAHSKLSLALVDAGFPQTQSSEGYRVFSRAFRKKLTTVLRGPARDRIVAGARWLTGWTMTALFDLPPLAFIGFAGYRIVGDYFTGRALPDTYFTHTGAVLGILLVAELVVLSILLRLSAWSARLSAARHLTAALQTTGLAFQPERAQLKEAIDMVEQVTKLDENLTQ